MRGFVGRIHHAFHKLIPESHASFRQRERIHDLAVRHDLERSHSCGENIVCATGSEASRGDVRLPFCPFPVLFEIAMLSAIAEVGANAEFSVFADEGSQLGRRDPKKVEFLDPVANVMTVNEEGQHIVRAVRRIVYVWCTGVDLPHAVEIPPRSIDLFHILPQTTFNVPPVAFAGTLASDGNILVQSDEHFKAKMRQDDQLVPRHRTILGR
jgi:hypothetical protein